MNEVCRKYIAIMLVILVSSLSITLYSGDVYADSTVCCEETESGEFCVSTSVDNCKGSSVSGSCDGASFCEPGCCVMEDSCYENVALAACTGEWTSETCGNIASCAKGCCVYGSNCGMMTASQCRKMNTLYDYPVSFNSEVGDELSCLSICVDSSSYGCCVEEDGIDATCVYTSYDACDAEFNAQQHCSAIEACGCTASFEKKCFDDDVYWYDSCGNREELVEECDFGSGTLCKDYDGDAKCISINCATTWNNPVVAGDGGARKNGESWCELDGAVGPGKDLVGSRYYRHMCVNGEELVEPCRDFREEICISATVGGLKEASCRENRARDCINQIKKSDCEQGDYRDCFWIFEDKDELEDDDEVIACLPLYAPGITFWPDLDSSDSGGYSGGDYGSSSVCSEADTTCDVYFVKEDNFDDWDCVQNCDCLKKDFAESANFRCVAIGDCGAHYNVKGVFTTGGYSGKVKEEGCSGSIHGEEFNLCADSLSDKFDDYKNAGLGIDFGEILAEDYVNEYASYIAPVVMYLMKGGGKAAAWLNNLLVGNPEGVSFSLGSLFGGGSNLESLISQIKADAPVGYVMARWQDVGLNFPHVAPTEAVKGIEGTAEPIISSSGITLNIGAGILSFAVTTLITFWMYKDTENGAIRALTTGLVTGIATMFNPLFGAIASLVMNFIWGKPEVEKYELSIKCLPWEAPDGGNKCEDCVEEWKTCSEYRCKSLGKTCKFIPNTDGGNGEGICVNAHPNDANSPVITADSSVLNEGYSLSVTVSGFKINEEVELYKPFTFGIITDEYASCKISETHTKSFDEMSDVLSDGRYLKAHNTTYTFEQGGENKEFYIRCKDASGNANAAEYSVTIKTSKEPDLTPVMIVNTSLESRVGYAAYDTNKSMVSIFVNELATCRWDVQDNDYANLGNSFACSTSSADGLSYECETSLDASQGTKFYVKCQDYAGNANSESYVLIIYPTEALNLTNILPTGTLYDNNIILSASTTGGAEGNAECRFSETSKSYNEMVKFFETGSIYHSQSLNLERGSYDYKIKCKDKAGNLAEGSASFVIDVDSNAPEVLSISRGGGQISVLFNEPSFCEYSTQSFDFGEGNSLNDNLNTLFSIPITENSFEYYLICEDEYSNEMDLMKIII